MNTLSSEVLVNPHGAASECIKFVIDDVIQPFKFNDIKEIGGDYTFSTWIKADGPVQVVINGNEFYFTDEWFKIELSFIADDDALELYFGDVGTYYMYHPKLELGHKATDWSPAPEDVQDNISAKPNTFVGEYITTTTGEVVYSYVDGYCCKIDDVYYQVTLSDGIYTATTTQVTVDDTDISALGTTPPIPYKVGDIWTTPDGYSKTCIVGSNTTFDSTHWTSSMEDLAKGLAKAQATIQTLIDKIQMIVVDENGGTLWEQTADGIKINFANSQSEINDLLDRVTDVEKTTSELDENISNNVNDSVEAFNRVKPYINMVDIENEDGITVPCIELGVVNNKLKQKIKVQITNEEIRFVENDIPVAYVNNEALQIKDARIKNTLFIGDYLLKQRPSGNLGITWSGTLMSVFPDNYV